MLKKLRLIHTQDLLGSLDVEAMTAGNVLFTFGILSVMAHLRPNFTYKYGADGKNIGVRLSLYGHTVVIEPVSVDAHAVRVIACRRGLAKLRKFNPRWVLPPSPMDGHSGPEWDWVQLLQGEITQSLFLRPAISQEMGEGPLEGCLP